MKKLTFITTIALLPFLSIAQSGMNCCSMSSTTEFAMLGKDLSFVNSHLSPLPFHLQNGTGKMIQFKTDDGKTGQAYEVKPEKPSGKFIFMIHEWWGLNDYIRQEAEKLKDELGDVTILALDLYDGKIASRSEDAQQYMQAVTEQRARAIINGALAYAGANAKIQTIGWCFGGGWSIQTALMAGKKNSGCVMYYGMPEKSLERLKTLNAPVLGIFGTQDKWISTEVVASFQNDMKAAGKKLTVKSYDADHAFANPSNPHYDMEKANDAHVLAIEFIKNNFK